MRKHPFLLAGFSRPVASLVAADIICDPKRKGTPLLLVSSFLFMASLAFSSPITYNVAVDTSSILGTSGSFDFNFNPGPLVTQAASLQIPAVSTDGTLSGSPALTGDVTGALPSNLTFDNGTAFNDYFQGFVFGSTLSFAVNLYGPALSSPDGVSTSGSTFAFSMFSDAAGTMPVLTTDATNGFAVTIDVNLDGSTTVNNLSTETTVSTPEPTTAVLSLLGAALIALRTPYLRRRLAAKWLDARLLASRK